METLKVKYTKNPAGGYDAQIEGTDRQMTVKKRQAATGYWVAADAKDKDMKGIGATRQEAVENLHAQY